LIICVFQHNPPGANGRLNEGGDRQNDQRLYNTQNNAAGGYGTNTYNKPLTFYEGSWLTVEWTNQHACSNANTDCALILQYMCSSGDAGAGELIRDGLTTDEITPENYQTVDEETKKYRYGLHESLEYFRRCEARDRNKGLFIADRNLNGENAQFTRQNNGGTRYAFECQEERDYYPYWHPTPWKDIAILTNDPARCDWYQKNSQNVMDKGQCEHENPNASLEDKALAWKNNNEKECTAKSFLWRKDDTRHNLAAPDCLKAPWSRDNHLGNGITTAGLAGHMNHYNFTLPTTEPCLKDDNCKCTLRLRYNTSTTDYEGYGSQSGFGEFVDSKLNGKDELALIKNNPTIEVGGKRLSHALNTNQVARTFQDRSHMFQLARRPAGYTLAQRIINLNVRGKRGNIVQTYPAVEYDFVPTFLIARQWDYVHIQWTGFDNNPNNGGNNAEGTQGTDRNNICQIKDAGVNTCLCDTDACYQKAGIEPLFEYVELRHKLAYLDQKDDQCDTLEQLKKTHNNNQDAIDNDKRNCMKLNAAPAYFDAGLVPLNRIGEYHYMSSRNNNFSNRSQKASITVLGVISTWAIVVLALGGVLLVAGLVSGALVLHGRSNPNSSVNKLFERI
jgi:hypothetical protein